MPVDCIYTFSMDRTNSDYFPTERQLFLFDNQGEVSLLRGTDWTFQHNLGKISSLNKFYNF